MERTHPTWDPTKELPPDVAEALGERRAQIAGCMAMGMTNQEIAQYLRLAVSTVKNYNSDIFYMLRVDDRYELEARAQFDELRLPE